MNDQRPRRTRLNMRIPTELLLWAKGYVVDRHTNLTQLFIDHLTKLKDQRNGHVSKRVESRRGATTRIQAGS